MKDALIVSLLSLVPRKTAARGMGVAARSGLSGLGVRAFIAAYGVDASEAEHDLSAYPTLEAFFTRRLKLGARPVDADPGAIVSPVDGKVAAVGRTVGGKIEVAPGRSVDVAALLGAPQDGERDAAVLYLSPKDYHRVHVPREGRATAWKYVPGTLWPVFPAAVRRVDGLFENNERAVVRIESDLGPVDVVLVGAFGVGRITLSVCDLVTNTGGQAASEALDPTVPVGRGDELGVFHLGSTVILVFPPGVARFTVAPGDVVRMGARIAYRT